MAAGFDRDGEYTGAGRLSVYGRESGVKGTGDRVWWVVGGELWLDRSEHPPPDTFIALTANY